MRRAVPLLAAIAVALLAGGPAALVAARPVPALAACSPAGSHDARAPARPRVYSLGEKVYGVPRSSGKTYKLGLATICIGGTRPARSRSPARRRLRATSCGVDFELHRGDRQGLTNGHTLRKAPATNRSLVEQDGSGSNRSS